MDDPAARLRARARAGDADAFGEVFDSCAKAVYNHAFRLTGDWSVAEDVMAQTFLEAWRSRERIAADGGSLRPWLLGIATNLARGHRRAARRQVAALLRLGPPPDVPDFSDDVTGRLDDANRIAALHRSLSRLRPDEFEVLALCVWSDLSYAETAEALGIPVGTVRSRLSRARARLLQATERDLHKSSRELTTRLDQLMGESANADPSCKEARQ
ncbi:MAG TPA: RNA polymerase sigma factor [Trebonia sp.]